MIQIDNQFLIGSYANTEDPLALSNAVLAAIRAHAV
jgi:hypothetical protein